MESSAWETRSLQYVFGDGTEVEVRAVSHEGFFNTSECNLVHELLITSVQLDRSPVRIKVTPDQLAKLAGLFLRAADWREPA